MYKFIQSALIIDNALEKFQINKAHQRSCVTPTRIHIVAKFEYCIHNCVFISVLSPENKIFLFSLPFKYHEAFNQQWMWATGSTTLNHHVSMTKPGTYTTLALEGPFGHCNHRPPQVLQRLKVFSQLQCQMAPNPTKSTGPLRYYI